MISINKPKTCFPFAGGSIRFTVKCQPVHQGHQDHLALPSEIRSANPTQVTEEEATLGCRLGGDG